MPLSYQLWRWFGEPPSLFRHGEGETFSRRDVFGGASFGPLVNKRIATGDVRVSGLKARSYYHEDEAIINKFGCLVYLTLLDEVKVFRPAVGRC